MNKKQLSLEQLSSAEERGNRLRILRNMSGLTIHEIAEKHGIGASTIKYWECAKNEGLSEKGAKKLIEALSGEGIYCSYMWLMHGVGIHPQYFDARYGDTKKQSKVINIALDEEAAIHKEIDLFLKGTPNAVTLTIFDDAMEPYYCLGDTVGGNLIQNKDFAKAIGKDCIIETEDRQILCRRCVKWNEFGEYTLCCLNPQTVIYPPNIFNIKIISIAPINRIWKRLG